MDGIRETAVCMQMGFVKILRSCANWISEVGGYVWDEESEEKEKPVKIADHLMDSTRYFCKTMRIAARNRQHSLI